MDKKSLLAATFLSTTFLAISTYADTASRCMSLIDKRAQGNLLQLSNCNLTPQNAISILNYLNTHPNITELQIDNNPAFGSAGIKVLAQNTTVETLSITGSNVDGDGYAALAKNATLKHLIRQDWDDDRFDGPSQLAGNTSLTSVNFENGRLSTEAVLALSKIQSLEEINLSSWDLNITTESILALNTLPKLKSLNVAGEYLSDKDLATLASNTNLYELGIGEYIYGAGSATLAAIAKNPNLTKIDMTISNNNVKDFTKLTNDSTITSLSLGGELTDETIAVIATMKNLTEIRLTLGSDNVNLIPLALQLPKLKKLQIHSYLQIDDAMANALAMNKNITELSLDNLPESAAIELAKSTSIQHLTIDNSFSRSDGQEDPNNVNLILNASLGELAKIPSLVELDYEGNFKIDKSVAAAIASNSNLKIAHFDRDRIMTKISGAAVQVFSQATNLTDLKLSSDDINDTAAVALVGNKTLQNLSLETYSLSDKGVKGLAKNTTLNSLTLNIGPVTGTAYNELMMNKSIVFINADINFDPKLPNQKRKDHK